MMPWQKDFFIKMAGMKKGEMKVAMAGRQIGKSSWAQLSTLVNNMMRKDLNIKIQWERLSNNRLRASGVSSSTHFDLLQESDMDPIQEWCDAHHCGIRTSFDTFKFRNKKQITMFLLRWA